jgi:hypothetical protein
MKSDNSGTRLYISADIEGIAGVVTRDQGGPGAFEYQQGREWMTGEVTAACEAAFEHGLTEVVVCAAAAPHCSSRLSPHRRGGIGLALRVPNGYRGKVDLWK